MNTRSTSKFEPVFALIATLWLAGCTTTPELPAIDTQALELQARTALVDGDVRRAADLFAQLAASVSGPQRATYLLEAARLEIELGNTLVARQLLVSAESVATPQQLSTAQLLDARIELAEGRPAEALTRSALLLNSDDTQLRVEALEVRGLAQFALGRNVDAIRSLSEREVWLDDIEQIRANQQTLWLNLFSVSAATQPIGDVIVDGWLALAPAARISDVQSQRQALLNWRRQYRQHPAAQILLRELLPPASAPQSVALLLPISSGAREEARAIRDGFLAAHMSESRDSASSVAGDNLTIRIYDTGTEGAPAAYQRAENEGADFIVGPLIRSSVEAVLPQAGLIPTLVLNHTLSDEEVFGNTWQFALAPEDEAASVARRAFANGQQRAVVLVPGNARGTRILNRFQQEFEMLGGQVLATMVYDGNIRAYGQRISALLNLDLSESRERTLQANLREDIEFVPRRRQDIDMIFLISNAADGRQLAPQLEYLYAGGIPTYAISDIHDLSANNRESDLNRIVFPQVPWLIAPDGEVLRLQRTIGARWPERSLPMARFFGMGVDSYRIMNTLYTNPFFTSVSGATGALRMDPQGRIHRDLPFAQFRGGIVEPLPDAIPDQLPVELGPEPELQPTPQPLGNSSAEPIPLGFPDTRELPDSQTASGGGG